MGNYNKQSTHLRQLITEQPIKRHRPKTVPVEKQWERSVSSVYSVVVKNQFVKVCMAAFLSIFDISRRRLHTIHRKTIITGVVERDMRGKKARSYGSENPRIHCTLYHTIFR